MNFIFQDLEQNVSWTFSDLVFTQIMSSYLLGVEEEMAEIRETKIQSGLSICIEVTSELILLF